MTIAMRSLGCIVAGTLFAFGPIETHLLCVLFIPFAATHEFKTSLFLVFCFMAAANAPSLVLAYEYTGEVFVSSTAYLVPILVNVTILGFALGLKRGTMSTIMFGVGVVVLSIPPISSVNPLSLISIAGLLFSGWATVGLVLFVVVLMILSQLKMKATPFAGLLMMLASTANAAQIDPINTVGIDTYRGQKTELEYSSFQMMYRHEEAEIAARSASTVLFPESTYREWNPNTAWLLASSKNDIIGGARKYISETEYVNVLINAKTGEPVYWQRSPLILNLDKRHTAIPIKAVSFRVDNSVSALICIEASNAWIALGTFYSQPKEVLFAANIGWSKHQWIAKRMVSTVNHWGMLYGVKTVTAINYAS